MSQQLKTYASSRNLAITLISIGGLLALVVGIGLMRILADPAENDAAGTNPPQGNPPNPEEERPLPKAGSVFTNSIGMKFAPVPKGSFWMGGAWGKPGSRRVAIPHDFYLGVYEVTQEQWVNLMGYNPSWFSRKNFKPGEHVAAAEMDQLPVENVTWNETQTFIKTLNEKEKVGQWLYRLPTAAEWEYACRGGANSQKDCSCDFYLDLPTRNLSSHQANFNGTFPCGSAPQGPFLHRPTKVGSYPPNNLGLYDMHGNVAEWCDDRFTEGRYKEFKDGVRQVRGGSWIRFGADCRASHYDMVEPTITSSYYGFRLARIPTGG
jgi:formylglycine-generating enzyme required for sulfatase activity